MHYIDRNEIKDTHASHAALITRREQRYTSDFHVASYRIHGMRRREGGRGGGGGGGGGKEEYHRLTRMIFHANLSSRDKYAGLRRRRCAGARMQTR